MRSYNIVWKNSIKYSNGSFPGTSRQISSPAVINYRIFRVDLSMQRVNLEKLPVLSNGVYNVITKTTVSW